MRDDLNMKADLITLHSVYNYGSVLQTYATQEIFKRHGVDVTTIDFVRENNLFFNRLKSGANNSILKEAILLPSQLKQKSVFDNFIKNNIKITDKTYTYDSDFDGYNSNADFFITGSDQVWNSTWNGGIVRPLYLSFVKSKPKFAFAASFGKEKIDEEEINSTKELIHEYKYISVRENSALNILKNQYGYENCEQILDPTLLLSGSDWRKIESKNKIKGKYILIYQLNSNHTFDKYASEVAKANNCKLVRICRRFDQLILNGKSIIIPKVEEFISLFDNAEMIITDSFHALSFSINLNKPFMCIYPPKFNTRLKSCLEMFELTDRLVQDYKKLNIFDKSIDWNKVNNILKIERDKSNKFIENCLEYVEKNGDI